MGLKKRITRLLNHLILNRNNSVKEVNLLAGFVSKVHFPERDLGVNKEEFRKSKFLTFDSEPEDRIKTICPTVYGTSPFIVILNNVFIIGGLHPIAVTAKFEVISDIIENRHLLYMGRVEKALRGLDWKTKLFFLNPLIRFLVTKKSKKIGQAVLLTSGWTHYGHWLLEHIIKLRYVFDYQQLNNSLEPVIILQKEAPDWQYDLLKLLNVERDQIMEWNHKPLCVENLVLPSYPEWNYDDYCWLRSNVFKNIKPTNSSVSQRIYLSRKNCAVRKVHNEDKLISLFEKYNIEVVYPENHTVFEQIEIFRSATLIIGPNGSAFANLIFSSNPIVIEFHGKEIRRTAYKISKIMGFGYFPFYCDIKSNHCPNSSGKVDEYLYPNLYELEKLLIEVEKSTNFLQHEV